MTSRTQTLQAALREIELSQKDLRDELAELEQVANGIRAVLARMTSPTPQVLSTAPKVEPPTSVQAGRYAGMSVRWGVLQYLAEDAVGQAISTADIAAALIEGGMTSNGRDFVSNVSAVVSVMVSKRGELEPVPGSNNVNSYRLTPIGQAAWNAIKMTNQYQARSLPMLHVQ